VPQQLSQAEDPAILFGSGPRTCESLQNVDVISSHTLDASYINHFSKPSFPQF